MTPIECDVEDCDNIAVWSIPRGKYTEHLCHKHHQECTCREDADDPDCPKHRDESNSYEAYRARMGMQPL